ncbi:hypothetical protein AAG906_018459 [Vitis piasezkii]
MHSEFKMSMMGELNFFLGLQIKQLKEGTFINQAKYIRDLLKRFNMEEAKAMKTPMSSSIKLDMDEKCKPVNSTMYRGMIGSLLYLTASRPDIMYSVCLCARFQSCPKESHLSAVKRILRYLKGTMDIGLWYPKGDNFELIGYSDADFVGCKVERKSTSGTCHFLGHSLVSWHNKKQNSVALSTAEAEYITAGLCCVQILWMKQTLSDFNLIFEHVPIKCDNTSAINISKNPVQHSRTKHIEIRHHFLRDHAQKGDITLEFRDGHLSGSWKAAKPSQPEQAEARRKASRSSRLWCGLLFPVTYGLGGPVLSTVRGVEIRLSPESICRILDIPSMGKPSTHSLTVTIRVFHHMICSILLPRGGHRDEVSYLEAFIMDSILTGRRIHVGYLMMMHMISALRALPSFQGYRVDLTRGTKHDIPPPPQSKGIHVEATFSEPMMTEPSFTAGPSSQPSFTELPSQAPHVPDHAPWMDVSAQISSLGTCMEELALVHDSRFYSMEEHLDQYQTGVTSRFDHFQQRFERIEERMDQQQATFDHLQQRIDCIESRQRVDEEMMAYLHCVSSSTPQP